MRSLTIRTLVALIASLGLAACGSAPAAITTGTATGTLPTQSQEADGVTVSVTQARLTPDAATFDVDLTAHAGELSSDLTTSLLTVDGTSWGTATYVGDGPGGHHRSGTITFVGRRPTAGKVVLSIPAAAGSVTFRWTSGPAAS